MAHSTKSNLILTQANKSNSDSRYANISILIEYAAS